MKRNQRILTAQKVLWALVLAAPLGACNALFGEEVARLPINAISTAGREVLKETSLPLKKDDVVALWSEMDMSYEGDAPVRFQILVLQNDNAFKQLELDPTNKNLTVGEVKTNLNGKVNWRFAGKNAELKIPENATYTFKARLVAANNPTLQVRKAELVLKK